MEWTREKTLTLIEEYRKRPGLWDMTHEDYRKKDIKKELLDQVAQEFNRIYPPVEIEKKFHTLRTQYHREINRMNQIRGNNNEPYKSKWFAFKHLEFLSSPNACRSGRSQTVKVKIEKPESNASITEGGDDNDDGDDDDDDHQQPATKYVIKSVPVHATTYTTTIPTHIQAEFITTTTTKAGNQPTTNHHHNVKNETSSVQQKQQQQQSVTASSNKSTSTTRTTRVKEIRRITRKELESLIEDATKNVDEQSEPDEQQQQQQNGNNDSGSSGQIIIKQVSCPSSATYDNHPMTVTEHHRLIHTGANTYETEPHTDEIITDEIHHDHHHQQHLTEAIAVGTATIQTAHIDDSGNYHNHHNQQMYQPTPTSQIKISSTGIKSASVPQQQHRHQQQRSSLTTSVDQQMYEEVLYEDQHEQQTPQQAQQQSSSIRKVYYEKVPVRDEFTIFGEYVANELRFISNKDILVTAKHKINTALFEACTSQLNRIE